MAAIDHIRLDIALHRPHGAAAWQAVSALCEQWAQSRGMALRDVVLLLPYSQLLPQARDAFARSSGWAPRVETTQTLAAALGPARPPQSDQLSFDNAIDRLTAARLLRAQASGEAWFQRDPRSFDQVVGEVVATAQAMAQAAAACPPTERAAHWERGRELLGPERGPGDAERRLARLALEWATLSPDPVTDRLFALRPSAWVAVKAGGADALAVHLMQQADDTTPCLQIDADVLLEAPFAAVHGTSPPRQAVCDSFEQEAQCTAAQVLRHLQRGEQPVALIAHDRVLVRRVRALLERSHVVLLDETGWKLSTTRAAAQPMSLLRAVAPAAGTDALFDWLKNLDTWPGVVEVPRQVDGLESHCRRRHLRRIDDVMRAAVEPQFQAFVRAVAMAIRPLQQLGTATATRWLDALQQALAECGALAAMQGDDAGRQVIAALHLDAPSQAWREAMGRSAMDLPAFTAWVDRVLEGRAFHPAAVTRGSPEVVITPLARAMLRPFAAVVFPGADDSRLGAATAPHALLSDTLLAALGLPDARAQREKELLAFAQVLAVPQLTLLRRRVDGGNPLGDSPLVERLALDLARRGKALAAWSDPRTALDVPATPVRRPSPAAADRLPARVSASAAEALRDCPYRFFAQHILRVREDDELGDDIEKRDYGTWLHAVLHAFHAGRAAPGSVEAEAARLRLLGREHRVQLGLADEQFLPFDASFQSFVPRYIEWLHARDAAGAHWRHGERALEIRPESLEGTVLAGIIDRIDEVRASFGTTLELIDYKTGSADSLKKKVKQPLEDTQLAFYAALMAGQGSGPLSAVYLALDGTQGLATIVHPDVERSAQALVDGLAHDLQRLRAGAGMPALGEGPTCEHCEARGLCRRDHWAAESAP